MNDSNRATPVIASPPSIRDNAPPDWATLSEEIACPLCGYNLRGLTEARCPECGYSFVWSELRDAANRKHPYLFEHHPDRSILKTAIGSLRPRRFWTCLTPAHTIFPVRLVGYWIIASFVGVGAMMIASFYPLLSEAYANSQYVHVVGATGMPFGATPPPSQPPSTPSLQVFFDYWKETAALMALGFCGFLMIWPWVTFLALMIFQISMRRAGIRKLHVLRVVLYSGDLTLWVGIIGVLTGAALLGAQMAFATRNHEIPETLYGWILIACWLIFAYRTYVAYGKYLRFDHPLATIIASQVVGTLFVLAIYFQLTF